MNATHAPRRVLVVLHPTQTDATAVLDGARAHGGNSRQLTHRAHAIDLPPGKDETLVLAALKNDPRFSAVELDQLMKPAFTPTDPWFANEWHASKIGCPEAWDVSRGVGVTIAILDTGVESTHPDLTQQLVPGWNVLASNTDTHDTNGHGTSVAGTAAAANNGWGVCGIAPGAKIMPIVVADPTAYAYWSNAAAGVTRAADNGARVANLSYSGASASAVMQSAGEYMMSKGGLLVVAAGNDSVDPGYTLTNAMLVVSATDENDNPTSWTDHGAFIDLAAPGIDIYTTGPAGQIWRCWGTSHSSPIVVGVVALMMAANPALPPSQIRSLILATCVDLGAAGRDNTFGAGRVSASGAVTAAYSATPISTSAPTTTTTSPTPSPKPPKNPKHRGRLN